MTTFKLIIALLFLCSCKSKSTDKNFEPQKITEAKDLVKSLNLFSFLDTLNKYKGVDTLYKNNSVFYVGNSNSKSFGLFQTTDTTFIAFQQNKQGWFVSDTLKLADIVNITYTDLNGDKYKDVLITQDYTAAGGNSENVVLLYRPQSARFIHNSSYDLPNIQYDRSKKLVYSAWWASANHSQEKMVYKLLGDTLVFDKGVTFIPDEQTQGDIGTVEFYIERNENRVITKTIKGKTDKIFDIFAKTIWDTTDE